MHENNENLGIVVILCSAVGIVMLLVALLKNDKNSQGE